MRRGPKLPAAGLALAMLILVVILYQGGSQPVLEGREGPVLRLIWQVPVRGLVDLAPAAGGGVWLLEEGSGAPHLRLLGPSGSQIAAYSLPGGLPGGEGYGLGPLGLARIGGEGEVELLTGAGRFAWRAKADILQRVVAVGEAGVLLAGRPAADETATPREVAILLDATGQEVWRQDTGGLVLAGAAGETGSAALVVLPLDAGELHPRYERFEGGVPVDGGSLAFLPMGAAYQAGSLFLWGPDGAALLAPGGDRLSYRVAERETLEAAVPLDAERAALLLRNGRTDAPLGELLLLGERGGKRYELDQPALQLAQVGGLPVLAGRSDLRTAGGEWRQVLEGRPRFLVGKNDMLYVVLEDSLDTYRLAGTR